MVMTFFRALAAGTLALGAPAFSQVTAGAGQAAPRVPPRISQRAEDLVALLAGRADPTAMFTPAFLNAVPAAQLDNVSRQLTAAHGAPRSVHRVEPAGPDSATVLIAMERALVRMTMGIEAAPPHRIVNLLVTGAEPLGGDSAGAIIQELRALPGQTGFAIARLGEGAPALIAAHQPERALAIGSTFKLVILAEVSRQVQAGRRRWTDVATVDRHSLPSGILQEWPLGSPVTLHTLATLMISRSDNTATDALLRLAGRDNVEAMMERMGMAGAGRNRPFLTTMEAFQLKAEGPELLARWRAGNEAARRRLLRERYAQGGASIDLSRLAAGEPIAIDTIEWFASARDLVGVMDWLRRHGDETAQSILAVSPGLSRTAAGEFGYVGYKGGSEPGVINLTYLIRNNGGVWHVVTGSWNNSAAALQEERFAALMSRAARLVR